jgi:hypothetical protein
MFAAKSDAGLCWTVFFEDHVLATVDVDGNDLRAFALAKVRGDSSRPDT